MEPSSISESKYECSDNNQLQLLIEEKDKLIDRLERQIENQKIQLQFYLRKELTSPVLTNFSHTCNPEVVEENFSVSVAIYKLYKNHGLKSRLHTICEKLQQTDGHISSMVDALEQIFEILSDKLSNEINIQELKKHLANFDINNHYIDLFNNLICTTISLKDEMKIFRINVEKLRNAEARRNEIVEKVLELPNNQQLLCKYLVGAKMETFELEHMVKELIKNQTLPPMIINGNDGFEDNLKNLDKKLAPISDQKQTTHSSISRMMEKMYEEAIRLLTTSKVQKDKYLREINELKVENRRLRSIIQACHNKPTEQIHTQTNFADIEQLHAIIKRTISEARSMEQEKTMELQQKTEECEKLKAELQRYLKENIYTSNKIDGVPDSNFLQRSSTSLSWFCLVF